MTIHYAGCPLFSADGTNSKASNRSDSSMGDRELLELKQAFENLQLEMAEFKLSTDTERDGMQAQIAMVYISLLFVCVFI